ncbi:MAG: sigma-70 family RNA polymerase sigma factor [Steroidobacteraceae bacterium]
MAVTADSDEALIARYARGDAAAFEVLYRRHELRIWRYLERHVGNRATADELMQEVWFAVARDAARYQPAARFTTWLFTIAHNRMIDAIRVSRRLTSLDAVGHDSPAVRGPLTADPRSGPLAAAVAQDQGRALHRALGELAEEQRDAFLLQVEGELSVEEIAAITQCSFETAKSRLRYARAKLRELLQEFA